MKRQIRILTIIFTGLIMTASATAQPMGSCPDSGPRHMQFKGRRMAANYENLRILKLLETLDLDEKQSETFIPLFHAFRTDIKELRQEREKLVDNLADAVGNPDMKGEIQGLLDKLDENEQAQYKRKQRFFNDSRDILTIEQMARMKIFQERFEREILEMLQGFRPRGLMRTNEHENP